MREPLLIVIAAPSGGGKSTVLARVFAEVQGLLFSISHTTRSPRKGEENGREYFFVSPERFRSLVAQDAFLEWAEVHGNLYGTTRGELDRARSLSRDLVLDIDVQGAEQVVKSDPKALTIFLKPPSLEVLKARLKGRGTDSAESLAVRFRNAEIELARAGEFQHVVVNDDLDAAVSEVKAIIAAERAKKTSAPA
ncbi:MAG TPA: guanylate kinase [Vicinamibacteria bacterium]|nr:guanylate kinase [Vicinamibacteria bacterium]